jgi:hypothetical protein
MPFVGSAASSERGRAPTLEALRGQTRELTPMLVRPLRPQAPDRLAFMTLQSCWAGREVADRGPGPTAGPLTDPRQVTFTVLDIPTPPGPPWIER